MALQPILFKFPECKNISAIKVLVDVALIDAKLDLEKKLIGKCILVKDLTSLPDVIVTDVYVSCAKLQEYRDVSRTLPVIVTRFCIMSYLRFGEHVCDDRNFHRPIFAVSEASNQLLTNVAVTLCIFSPATKSYIVELVEMFKGKLINPSKRVIDPSILLVHIIELEFKKSRGDTHSRTSVTKDWLFDSVRFGKIQNLSRYSNYRMVFEDSNAVTDVPDLRNKLRDVLQKQLPPCVTLLSRPGILLAKSSMTPVETKELLHSGLAKALGIYMDFEIYITEVSRVDSTSQFQIKDKSLILFCIDQQKKLWGIPYEPAALCIFHVVVLCEDSECKNICGVFEEVAKSNPEYRYKHDTEGTVKDYLDKRVPIIVHLKPPKQLSKFVNHGIERTLVNFKLKRNDKETMQFVENAFIRAVNHFAVVSEFIA